MEKPEATTRKSPRVRETVVEPVKPVLRSDAETINIYMDLLQRAPATPFLTTMEETTVWLDKYNRWLREVRHEVPL